MIGERRKRLTQEREQQAERRAKLEAAAKKLDQAAEEMIKEAG